MKKYKIENIYSNTDTDTDNKDNIKNNSKSNNYAIKNFKIRVGIYHILSYLTFNIIYEKLIILIY